VTEPFVMSRVFDASRERVWRAWTDVEQLKRWWGPKGFTVAHCTLDLQPGGRMHYCLRGPDGSEMWGKFAYREVVAPERLVWVNSFSDKDGGTTIHPMMPTWPREMLSTALFEEHGKGTKLTIRWLPLEGSSPTEILTFEAGRPSMTMGWTGTMEVLAEHLGRG
jgi:uncharacterized protein YndB with AHSA1/START domain